MRKLTQKDDQGNWCLRGVPWVNLRAGQVITDKTAELLYGALWKLMEYEATDLTPEEVERSVREGASFKVTVDTVVGNDEVIKMTTNSDDRCPRCWDRYQLAVRPRPVTIKSWTEDGKKVTNRKYVCSCGCSWESTRFEDLVFMGNDGR